MHKLVKGLVNREGEEVREDKIQGEREKKERGEG